jgi:hypothetical protein
MIIPKSFQRSADGGPRARHHGNIVPGDSVVYLMTARAWIVIVILFLTGNVNAAVAAGASNPIDAEYASWVQPRIHQYCLGCHSAEKHKGSLDLERFATPALIRRDVKPWQAMVEQLESAEMPPKKKPQPTDAERARLIAWVRGFLDREAMARAGDPGFTPMRRLSNAEYDYIIRDLTGIDSRPAREFPADGAAGEGFTNAAEALSDMSPTLLNKYLLSAKEIASHAVFLPDGFRFSPNNTRRDWSNESVAKLRHFYAQFTADGKLPLQPYLAATLRRRDALLSGKITIDDVAGQEKLNPKFLRHLWNTLTAEDHSFPLELIRSSWRGSSEKESGALAAKIAAFQGKAWKITPIGSYRYGNVIRQQPNDAAVADAQTVRLTLKPAPAQDVTLYLCTREIFPGAKGGNVIWSKPRLEARQKPALLLRDYQKPPSSDDGHTGKPDGDTASAAPASDTRYGLDIKRFGVDAAGNSIDAASLSAPANSIIEIRLPAAIFRDHEFVVEGKLAGDAGDRVARFEVRTTPPDKNSDWNAAIPMVASPAGAAGKQLLSGLERFREAFPLFICFPAVIPVDEIVCLKMYHREDGELIRLFLDDAQRREIDRLWEEHRFITQQPVAENRYLPLFIGFVTQDQPGELLKYFESQRAVFRKRADDFLSDLEAAVPKQLEAVEAFASRAYRRPLDGGERREIEALYAAFRAKGGSSEDALRAVLSRVLVAPSFLLHVEQAPAGKEAGTINDWELATRLSLFLWSSVPDEELRALAAAGRLHEPAVLAEQARRMLKDDRVRALAIEFGAQWIHVRGFDEFKEKSETLYPGFDQNLRSAMYEESILFFQDLFQQDRPVRDILDADYTYLNQTLARHYDIPGVRGPQWRKVEGVKKYGRGGILGLGSVQAKQAGAARTSPVLRGNWVVETLLGEKLPRPPPDVPRLPETEGSTDGLTMRQLVEKHVSVESCAVCHVRIDPIGFSFERYDAIGRLRSKESSSLPIDCRATMKDGTEFEGIDGLRNYLLTKKKDVIVRLFCRRLLGYALDRSVTLSDQSLVDEMAAALNKRDGTLSAAVLTIVGSRQFRMIRGSTFVEGE